MAELHRRVLGLPRRKGLATLCALVVFAAALPSARAEDVTLEALEGWAEDLTSEDAAKRDVAFEALRTLPRSALPAIDARIARTRRQEVPEEDGYDALRFFRHATGSRRADDMGDIAEGVLAVLAERRSRDVGRTAERLLYLRSLEGMGDVEAQRRIGDVFALTPRMWRWEQRRLVERMGRRLVPGLLILRGHEDPNVRRWARTSLEEVGADTPARAVQEEDPEILAAILDAYGDAREMDAMNVVISFVGHPDDRLRDAARGAMDKFAHNGIWRLREAFRSQLGEDADTEWGWRRTSQLLYERLDAERLAPVDAILEEGLAALEAGDEVTARERFDAVLLAAPEHPRRAILGPGYARLAHGDPALLRRAIRLAPDDGRADEWRAELLRIEADADRARGVFDADAYATGVAEDREASSAPTTARANTEGWSWLGWLALALAFSMAMLSVLRSDRVKAALTPRSREPREETLSASWRVRLRDARAGLRARLPSSRKASPSTRRSSWRRRLKRVRQRLRVPASLARALRLAVRFVEVLVRGEERPLSRRGRPARAPKSPVASEGSVEREVAPRKPRVVAGEPRVVPREPRVAPREPRVEAREPRVVPREPREPRVVPREPRVVRDAHAAALLLGLERPRGTTPRAATDTMKEPPRDPVLDELLAASRGDTSPGTIEAPDTLPG